MNSKPYFRVELTEEDQIHVECDGSGQELMNLFTKLHFPHKLMLR